MKTPTPSPSASSSPSPSPSASSGRSTWVAPSNTPVVAASGGGAPWVWMPNQVQLPIEYAPGYRILGNEMGPGAMGATDASNYFWQMSESDQNRLSGLVGAFGQDSTPAASTMQYYWNQAVAAASAINQRNPGAKASPWDLLSRWAKNGGPGGSGPGGSGSGPRTTHSSQTSRSVQKINAQQAKPLLRQTLEALVGRSFSDDEVTAFVAQFNAEAQKNPTVTKANSTTTVSGSSSSTSTSSTTSGGVDAGQIADEFARSRKDYAEYQVAVPLMQAFMQAIQSPEGAA